MSSWSEEVPVPLQLKQRFRRWRSLNLMDLLFFFKNFNSSIFAAQLMFLSAESGTVNRDTVSCWPPGLAGGVVGRELNSWRGWMTSDFLIWEKKKKKSLWFPKSFDDDWGSVIKKKTIFFVGLMFSLDFICGPWQYCAEIKKISPNLISPMI